MENSKLTVGSINRHVIADLHGVKNVEFYDQVENMRNLLYAAASIAKMNIVGEAFKQFSPQGSSGALIISESHITYHFWPEFQFMSLDILTCGAEGDPQAALDYLLSYLNPDMGRSKVMHLDRSFSLDGL